MTEEIRNKEEAVRLKDEELTAQWTELRNKQISIEENCKVEILSICEEANVGVHNIKVDIAHHRMGIVEVYYVDGDYERMIMNVDTNSWKVGDDLESFNICVGGSIGSYDALSDKFDSNEIITDIARTKRMYDVITRILFNTDVFYNLFVKFGNEIDAVKEGYNKVGREKSANARELESMVFNHKVETIKKRGGVCLSEDGFSEVGLHIFGGWETALDVVILKEGEKTITLGLTYLDGGDIKRVFSKKRLPKYTAELELVHLQDKYNIERDLEFTKS